MKAALLTIGSEITAGHIVNSNAAYLSKKLALIDVETVFQLAIPDDLALIVSELKRLLAEVEVLIITGGLGPTADDLTRDAVAQACEVEYAIDKDKLEKFNRRYQETGVKMPVNNDVQFSYPKNDGIAIPNEVGVALGFMITKFENKLIAVLPGVPRELKPMFENFVIPEIAKRFEIKEKIYERTLKCFGAYESIIDEKIRHICDPKRDPQGGIQASDAIITIRFKTKDASEQAALERLAQASAEVKKILGPIVFAESDDELYEVVVRLLADGGRRVGVAESCTAGLVTHYLGKVPGVSTYLKESIIAYSNESKMARLAVPEQLFIEHGAVSPEVARAMTEGLLKTCPNVDVAVSTTGIAGPGGATLTKPVGLVYIAVAEKNLAGKIEKSVVRKFNLRGDRAMIQNRAALCALNLLRLFLLDRLDVPDLGTAP